MKKIFLSVAVVMLVVFGTIIVSQASILSYDEATVISGQTGHAFLSYSGGDFEGNIALGNKSLVTHGNYQVFYNIDWLFAQ